MKKSIGKKVLAWLAVALLVLSLAGCGNRVSDGSSSAVSGKQEMLATEEQEVLLSEAQEALAENGSYTSKEDVAQYLLLYGKLPDNFITKKEAQNLGWEGGELEPYAPGKSIGGDRFGNYEGLLPEADGRVYYECDIDTLGKKRGAKRIVYSNDGLIYYTEDHYESFVLLYGDDT